MHVEIPRVATYFSEQNKICFLGIFSYVGYFPDGILSFGILSFGILSFGIFSFGIFSSGILTSWDFFLWDFFLMGFFFLHEILSSWDFIRIPYRLILPALLGFFPLILINLKSKFWPYVPNLARKEVKG